MASILLTFLVWLVINNRLDVWIGLATTASQDGLGSNAAGSGSSVTGSGSSATGSGSGATGSGSGSGGSTFDSFMKGVKGLMNSVTSQDNTDIPKTDQGGSWESDTGTGDTGTSDTFDGSGWGLE